MAELKLERFRLCSDRNIGSEGSFRKRTHAPRSSQQHGAALLVHGREGD
jgi:hypothetical protein